MAPPPRAALPPLASPASPGSSEGGGAAKRQPGAQQGEMWSLREGGRTGQGAEPQASQGARGSAGPEARRGLLRLPAALSCVYGHTTLNAPDLV